jgi:hypothetical protein
VGIKAHWWIAFLLGLKTNMKNILGFSLFCGMGYLVSLE